MNLLGPRADAQRSAAIRELKQRARTLFEAEENDVVVVNELACAEPGCPPVETVVALLREGCLPRQLKVHKPVVDVTEADLLAALRSGHGAGHTGA